MWARVFGSKSKSGTNLSLTSSTEAELQIIPQGIPDSVNSNQQTQIVKHDKTVSAVMLERDQDKTQVAKKIFPTQEQAKAQKANDSYWIHRPRF